ncbi:16S rRNA (guanine(527)-N(7))-methyltransferase RsmG [Cytophagaceae bacterium ABcell3]|nr:16S rRNA (guanine(527)-N(7))-methyltransferase RsmG [Cytophagaceae bacterium ABcell3]
MELILKYFPNISEEQKKKFEQLEYLYKEWNEKINVVSRKDIDQLYERHILHSLGIAKVIQFKARTSVLDIGTGGGFPGIPLAIMFPDVHFFLVDSIGKKIKVVKAIAEALELNNVKAEQIRAEKIDEQFDFIVSRAVTDLKTFRGWTKGKLLKGNFNTLDNGILYLKGGDLSEEIKEVNKKVREFPLSEYFQEPFFETKKVVYLKA